MEKVVVKYFGVAVMEELMAWFSDPLPRPTNQTSGFKERLVSRLLFILTPHYRTLIG